MGFSPNQDIEPRSDVLVARRQVDPDTRRSEIGLINEKVFLIIRYHS
jgi:hypothetical protein